jgi:hypothetical protein
MTPRKKRAVEGLFTIAVILLLPAILLLMLLGHKTKLKELREQCQS